MTTLPYDFHRCAPLHPDAHCRQCLRWEQLQGQTFGPRTPVAIGRLDSQDGDCSYIHIEEKA